MDSATPPSTSHCHQSANRTRNRPNFPTAPPKVTWALLFVVGLFGAVCGDSEEYQVSYRIIHHMVLISFPAESIELQMCADNDPDVLGHPVQPDDLSEPVEAL